MLEEDIKPREPVARAAAQDIVQNISRAATQLANRMAGYFKPVINPALGRRARFIALLKAAAASGVIGVVLLVVYAIVLIPFTPGIADIRKAKAETPSVLVSADGKELAVFKRMNREWVELDRISPHVINALIATEDHRFYQHFGVDLKRTAAGILRTLQGDPEGGSTLTQQLARNLYPEEIGRQRTITRKIKELITALKIEYAYSKKEILLTYLNTMPFLYNAFGIEMGARTYFDKSAADLNVLESATLVGMLKGTSYYNPVLRPERALERRNVVLSLMAKRGVLGKGDLERLKTRPLRLDFERQPEPVGVAPHLAVQVRKWLIDWADRNDYNLYSDGLVVESTIDSRMQSHAEQAVARQMRVLQGIANSEWGTGAMRRSSGSAAINPAMRPFGYLWKTRGDLVDAFIRESAPYRKAIEGGTAPELALKQLKENAAFMVPLLADKTRLETGFLAIDPVTGHVKAWVGSRDFTIDQFDHVATARRQPGSTFKPFVYGAALEKGMSPDKRFADTEVEIKMADGTVWKPTDMSGPSGRDMTLREGLALSKNTITAQVMQEVGPRRVADFARRLGVNQSPLEQVPALALGTSPVTLLEMVSAYGTIATGGEARKPIMVSRILDKDGKVLDTFTSDGRRVLDEDTAYDLTGMLRAVIDQGTGRAIKWQVGSRVDVAGKTGTTQNNTDGWFILMHPRLVAGAWVGFNDARVTMRSNRWGQGAHTALPMVGDFTRRTLQARLIDANARFPKPPESFFASLVEKVTGFFSWKKDEPPAPRRPAAPPRAPAPEPVPDMREDEMERITEQAVDAMIPPEPAMPPGAVMDPVPESPAAAGR
ncbi:MAG TPA: transglycosylase domain-containing protein [Noviherbaspirillum sp.]|nr:transglycosylase domain-containing protein [Noviherbaspirillum sp.]